VLKNDELAAHYLSRNMDVFKNVEDDSQKTLRLFKEYTTLAARSGGAAGMKKWVENVGKGDQFALQVFQCTDDVRYFNILNMFGDTYHHSTAFSIKFVRQNLHGLSGGVSEFEYTNDTGLVDNRCTDYRRSSREVGEHHEGTVLEGAQLRDGRRGDVQTQ
jgi:hypothetical protein